MIDDEMKLSPSQSKGEPINPYAAPPGTSGSGRAATSPLGNRRFQIRMDWAARRRFLKCAFPLRTLAIVGGVSAAYAFYCLVIVVYESWRMGLIRDLPSSMFFVSRGFSVAILATGILTFWTYWKFTDAMVATAGGRVGDMDEWSRMQARLVWLIVVALGLSLLNQGWLSLIPYVMPKGPL